MQFPHLSPLLSFHGKIEAASAEFASPGQCRGLEAAECLLCLRGSEEPLWLE